MAPQPFMPQFRGKHFCFDGRGLAQDAKAAALLGQILGEWSRVEHQNAMLVAALIGDNPRPGLALFTALRGSRSQRDAKSAVAGVSLSENLKPIFAALSKLHDSMTKERNKLVHGVIGWSSDIPEATLIIHSDSIADHEATAWVSLTDTGQINHDRLGENIYVYRHDDFLDIFTRMEKLKTNLFYMYCIVRHGVEKQRNMLNLLSDDPDIKARM